MKKIAAIFLLSVYLLSVVSLHELLKINMLVEHFQETKVKDNSISFFDFLVMHYITDDGNSQDDDRDNQLPFKSHSRIVTGSIAIFILNITEETVITPIGAAKSSFPKYVDHFIASNFCDLVWHPPKVS